MTTIFMKSMAHDFVYETNVGSVQRFSRELTELSLVGYNSTDYNDLFENMIRAYNKTLGEKESIVTFLLDDSGWIEHSNFENQMYLDLS